MGVEKVSISTAAVANPELLTEIAAAIGRQSVVATLDVRRKAGLFGSRYEVRTQNGRSSCNTEPLQLARQLQDAGAGEIVLNSIDRDGEMKGYDVELARALRGSVGVPVTILGGAGSFADIANLIEACGVIGAAAGSLFVFKGPYRAVLISYPTFEQKEEICARAFSSGRRGNST